ncbi:hypothetical protein MTO96_043311 [Rhipicephalus appendiculatus]
MMMFGRELPTALTYLNPSDSQLMDEEGKDERRIRKNQIVYVNFAGNPAWIKGTIIKQVGRRSWLVSTDRGVVRRHKNHIHTTRQEATHDHASTTESPGNPRQSSLLPFFLLGSQTNNQQEAPTAGAPECCATPAPLPSDDTLQGPPQRPPRRRRTPRPLPRSVVISGDSDRVGRDVRCS